MGENFPQERAASFKQQQCAAYARELKQATLFAHVTEALTRTIACTAEEPVPHLIGERVLLFLRDDGVSVDCGNRKIACVTDGDTSFVTWTIESEPHCSGVALAIVVDASSVTGELTVL